MPKKELAPEIGEVSPTEHKSRKRKIKRLVQLRLGYGKSTFYDTNTHQPRYPIDEIGPALYKYVRKAAKIKKEPDLSTEEKDLWKQIFKVIAILFGFCMLFFYTDIDGDHVPDFFEFLNHLRADPDFIEKALGLEDDAIEKGLGLTEHSIEQRLKTTVKMRQEKL
jgi:hypothetical protein